MKTILGVLISFLLPTFVFAAKEDIIKKAVTLVNKKNSQEEIQVAQLSETATTDFTENIPTEITKLPETAEKKSKLENVILAFDSENVKTVTGQNAAAYSGDIEAYQYLKTGYKITDKTSLLMVNTWVQRLGYKENSSQTTFNDSQLRLTKSDFMEIGKMKFSGQIRAYLPTSRTSNYQDQVVHLRTYFLGVQELTKKLSLTTMISPRYSIQENKDYVNATGATVNTMEWAMFNTVGLKYAFTDKFAIDTAVGVYTVKSHNSETAHLQDFSTVAHYMFNKNFSLRGGIRASLTTNIDTDGVELYDHNNSEYVVLAAMTL